MPGYETNPGGGQSPGDDSDYFSDGPKGESKDEVTGILPKEILQGKEFKPGEEVVLKIVAIHDKDIEVAYSTGEEGKEKEGGEEAPPPEQPQPETQGAPSSDMASMMY